MHDPRVGRFFATDPLEKKYPFYSPYAFSGNRVIDAVELEGLEPGFNWGWWFSMAYLKIKLSLSNSVERMASPIKQNNETINNNPLISEEDKQQLYMADAVSATVDLQGKILATGTIASGTIIGGGVLIAETGLVSAAGTTLSTEFGYLASSGPLWQSSLSSISIGSVGEGSAWYMFTKGATNLGGQVVSNNFKLDKEINLWQPFAAAFSDGIFSNTLESSFKISYSFDTKHKWNFGTSNSSEFISSFSGNAIGGKVSNSFESIVKPVNNFSITTKPIFDLYGGTLIEASENEFSKKVEENLNKKFSSPNKQSQNNSNNK